DDHVAAVRKPRERVTARLRQELLDRREDHAPSRHREQSTKFGPVLRLPRSLPQQPCAPREDPEQLVVQIVAVRQHHDRRIRKSWLRDEVPRVEEHRQTLAGSLRVPHNSRPTIAAGSAQGRRNGFAGRVELVITGDLLREAASFLLVDDEAPDQLEEAGLVENSANEYLQSVARRDLTSVHRSPRSETFAL